MVVRDIQKYLISTAKSFPVIVITGPRQSGKTTLARNTFPTKPYVLLEDPDTRESAESDPRAFLQRFNEGAIFDEIQNTPQLISYVQGIVDANPQPGRFILTGSHQFDLLAKVTQSLAGRSALIELLLRTIPISENASSKLRNSISSIPDLPAGCFP